MQVHPFSSFVRFTDCTLTRYILLAGGQRETAAGARGEGPQLGAGSGGVFENTNPSRDFVAFEKASHKLQSRRLQCADAIPRPPSIYAMRLGIALCAQRRRFLAAFCSEYELTT
jgi:hypothetical protein